MPINKMEKLTDEQKKTIVHELTNTTLTSHQIACKNKISQQIVSSLGSKYLGTENYNKRENLLLTDLKANFSKLMTQNVSISQIADTLNICKSTAYKFATEIKCEKNACNNNGITIITSLEEDEEKHRSVPCSDPSFLPEIETESESSVCDADIPDRWQNNRNRIIPNLEFKNQMNSVPAAEAANQKFSVSDKVSNFIELKCGG